MPGWHHNTFHANTGAGMRIGAVLEGINVGPPHQASAGNSMALGRRFNCPFHQKVWLSMDVLLIHQHQVCWEKVSPKLQSHHSVLHSTSIKYTWKNSATQTSTATKLLDGCGWNLWKRRKCQWRSSEIIWKHLMLETCHDLVGGWKLGWLFPTYGK